MGDQVEWGRWIPTVWQMLADPDATHIYPPAPESAAPLGGSTEWWGPVLHVLAYSLGWPRIDVGLARWYEAGQPTDDPRLALLKGAWGAHLDVFAAWIWDTDGTPLSSLVADALGVELDQSRHPEVIACRNRIRASLGEDLPHYQGGSDPLHLAHHAATPLWREADDRHTRYERLYAGETSATLILSNYAGWYRTLTHLGVQLPTTKTGRSRRVDVIVRPVGWLGTYRRSRVSGRWFAGRHRTHEIGVP